MERRKFIVLGSAAVVWPLSHASLAVDYKPEFKMSVIVTEDTAWGRAATRFADAVRLRTDGRIKIKNYFEGRLFAGEQTTEFKLIQQGTADYRLDRQLGAASKRTKSVFAPILVFRPRRSRCRADG
jgi:TRAP-type C4-dicarboxylate transport system substrate-binding protein